MSNILVLVSFNPSFDREKVNNKTNPEKQWRKCMVEDIQAFRLLGIIIVNFIIFFYAIHVLNNCGPSLIDLMFMIIIFSVLFILFVVIQASDINIIFWIQKEYVNNDPKSNKSSGDTSNQKCPWYHRS